MQQARIKHIVNLHYTQFKKHIKNSSQGFDAEQIHQLRVAYKKLRAFLRMLSQQNKTGEIKITKKIKNAYHVSGLIRDLLLQQQRIAAATNRLPQKPQAYLHVLQKEMDKLKPVFLKMFSAKNVASNKKKITAALPHQFPLSGFQLFMRKKWAVIAAIISSRNFSDDNIHAIRKNLKDVFYTIKIYSKIYNKTLPLHTLTLKDEKYFDELLDELGNFQDKCMAIALLKSYRVNNIDPYSGQLLQQVKKSWIKDKTILKALLVKKISSELSTPPAAKNILFSPSHLPMQN